MSLARPATYRVLMTADTLGGVWSYALDLARGLCARGHQVILAAMGAAPTAGQRVRVAAVGGLTLHAQPYKLEWMEDPWEDIAQAGIWLSELAREYRPDLVHLNTLAHGALDWDVPVITVGHSCVMSWFEAVRGQAPIAPEELVFAGVGELELDEEERARWTRYRDLVRPSLRASHVVVAPSATMLQALQRHYGICVRTRVIDNGRNPDDFLPTIPEPIVLSAGRLWDEAKNAATLARAAAAIDWPVYIAGESAHPDGGSAGFRGVTLLGQLAPAQLCDWYARSSIYALPARYEPFGLTPLEAALAGNALVLGDIPSLREIWGDAALFVDPLDSKRLADAINALITDTHLRTRLAEEARRRALKLSLHAMIDGYLQLYREVCAPLERAAYPAHTGCNAAGGGRH